MWRFTLYLTLLKDLVGWTAHGSRAIRLTHPLVQDQLLTLSPEILRYYSDQGLPLAWYFSESFFWSNINWPTEGGIRNLASYSTLNPFLGGNELFLDRWKQLVSDTCRNTVLMDLHFRNAHKTKNVHLCNVLFLSLNLPLLDSNMLFLSF